jgi:type II secretory pathway pseudopilin PulG
MKRSPRRRGFTIILAVVLLGLVAVAAAMIVHQLGYELQRTRTAYEDAQLRQLLLAGAEQVETHGDQYRQQGKMEPQALDLPTSLATQGASVSISSDQSAQRAGDILIIAHLGGRDAQQTLHWDDASHQWSVAPAEE